MFKNITDLSFERNWKQAMGFCLAFFFSLIILALAIGIINIIYLSAVGGLPKSTASFQAGNEFGKKIIPLFAFLSTLVAILIVRAKKVYSAKALIGAFLAAVLSFFTLVVFSFIPIAYLTTLPKSTPPQGS